MSAAYRFGTEDLVVKTIDSITGYYVIPHEITRWLGHNLRRRSTDIDRRYRYSTTTVRANNGRGFWVRPIQRKTVKTGVYIYDEADALAFKLRWCK